MHRLPVLGSDGTLEGVISLNDLVLAAEKKRGKLGYDEVMNTLKTVNEHPSHLAPFEETEMSLAATA